MPFQVESVRALGRPLYPCSCKRGRDGPEHCCHQAPLPCEHIRSSECRPPHLLQANHKRSRSSTYLPIHSKPVRSRGRAPALSETLRAPGSNPPPSLIRASQVGASSAFHEERARKLLGALHRRPSATVLFYTTHQTWTLSLIRLRLES